MGKTIVKSDHVGKASPKLDDIDIETILLKKEIELLKWDFFVYLIK